MIGGKMKERERRKEKGKRGRTGINAKIEFTAFFPRRENILQN